MVLVDRRLKVHYRHINDSVVLNDNWSMRKLLKRWVPRSLQQVFAPFNSRGRKMDTIVLRIAPLSDIFPGFNPR